MFESFVFGACHAIPCCAIATNPKLIIVQCPAQYQYLLMELFTLAGFGPYG